MIENTLKKNKVKDDEDGDIPFFIKHIMSDDEPNILPEQKQRVMDEFLPKYLNDEEYRESVQGKYLVFCNGIYCGVMDEDEKITDINIRKGYTPFRYKIKKKNTPDGSVGMAIHKKQRNTCLII